MTVGVVPNADRDADLRYTREVCAFLRGRGVTPLLEHAAADALGLAQYGAAAETVYGEPSFIAVLGGDGTMLRAARHAARYGTPMLGINLGTLGYLTDVDQHEGLQALDKAIAGDCKREKRLMLAVDGHAARDLTPDERLALNDVCISRGGLGKLITLSLYVNGLYMDTLRADGVIIATPTGSTAYNLSAGGPILSPDGDMMAVTAVCAHALHTRPWVINARDTVEIRLDEGGQAAAALDGETRFILPQSESITVRRAGFDATILKTSALGFYEILRRKLR